MRAALRWCAVAGAVRSESSTGVHRGPEAGSEAGREGMDCHGGRVVMDGERGAAMMIRRTEIMSIGEQLVAASARAGPLDIARVGGLLRRLGPGYRRCVGGDGSPRPGAGVLGAGARAWAGKATPRASGCG